MITTLAHPRIFNIFNGAKFVDFYVNTGIEDIEVEYTLTRI